MIVRYPKALAASIIFAVVFVLVWGYVSTLLPPVPVNPEKVGTLKWFLWYFG